MPVHINADLRCLNQDEFRKTAYYVMEHVFEVHRSMGRFFDEGIYRDAVAARLECPAQTEVLIEVTFESFRKEYRMDLLANHGGVFEFKTVKALGGEQRAQTLNYLLLCELSHAKLVNFRPERVEHEFVNTRLKRADRVAFQVVEKNWMDPGSKDVPFRPWLEAFLRDVGAGLDLHLYEAAASHFFGGEDSVLTYIEITSAGHRVGRQKVRIAAPRWAFKATTLKPDDLSRFEDHLRRFLNHTDLDGFHWINITREVVRFATVRKDY